MARRNRPVAGSLLPSGRAAEPPLTLIHRNKSPNPALARVCAALGPAEAVTVSGPAGTRFGYVLLLVELLEMARRGHPDKAMRERVAAWLASPEGRRYVATP